MSYQLFNEDCLQGMERIPDGSVDAIICDPPFGTTDCTFDVRLPLAPMWNEFKRLAKSNAAICLFCQFPFGADLITSNRKMFRYKWVWEKSLGVGYLNVRRMPLRCHEDILIFYQKLPTYNPQFRTGKARPFRNFVYHSENYTNKRGTKYKQDGEHYHPRDVLYFPSTMGLEERFHPTQKPVSLLEYLIRTYTNEGETVLDATMGSGSTGVACMNTGRNFIGFETEKNFYDIACKRLSDAQAKQEQSLFKDVGA